MIDIDGNETCYINFRDGASILVTSYPKYVASILYEGGEQGYRELTSTDVKDPTLWTQTKKFAQLHGELDGKGNKGSEGCEALQRVSRKKKRRNKKRA